MHTKEKLLQSDTSDWLLFVLGVIIEHKSTSFSGIGMVVTMIPL